MSNPYDDGSTDVDSTDIGDGIYYDGGLYGPDGGPDTPAVPARLADRASKEAT